MEKKVLVLSGSPRKGGNSDTLCDSFIEGAQSAGHQAEKIFIRDSNINYCTGCGVCIDRTKGCSQKDDMKDILAKMVAADVIVMATPVYFYTMNGQMKTLIDRCCARYTEISDKDFYFIMTAADDDNTAMDRTIEEFRGFTYCLTDAHEKGVIKGLGLWQKNDVRGKEILQEAFKAGASV
jgi:Multimeric flavodoxin WrbA